MAWELPPTVYHMVDARNWAAVRRDGLRPADMLADAALPSDEAVRLCREWRAAEYVLPSGAVLRDQRPMPPRALDACLADGLAPDDWYALINMGVYFWVDRARLTRHAAAQSSPPMVLHFDAVALAERYRARSYVTAFNTGAACRRPAPRGPGTFVPLDDWQHRGWASERPTPVRGRRASHPIAELVMRCAIPDAMAFVHSVELPQAKPPPASVGPVSR